jgi:TonB-linked SusC/RagA family outer membrane protein
MRSLFLILLISFMYAAVAQVSPVAGRITNAKGEPVSFATVKVKGKKTTVSADAGGLFSIDAAKGETLIITAINYASIEVAVTGKPLTPVLPIKETALNEVVVTALGQSQTKAKLGYSTSTFSTATINKNGAVGVLDGLEGKVAGADISSIGGPGASTKVVLRGYGVIAGGNNQPLYVIDGVPLSDGQFQNNTTGLDGTDFGNGMNNINPNDIESISILKGTAASSLYGGLAKNGVIMITTKKGHAGQLRVDFSTSANISKVGKLPTYQSEFGQGWGGIFVSDENGSWGPALDGKERLWGSVVDNSQLEKPFSFIKNNLRSFFNTGTEYNNSVSLSGGNDASRFYFSYSNVTSDGIVPYNANFQERNTFALRTNSNFGDFSINTSFNYVNQRLNVPGTGYPNANGSGGGVFNSLMQIPVDVPISDFKNINNKFFNVDNYFTPYAENPYFALEENGNKQNLDRFFGNVDLGYKFSTHLSAELRLGGDFTDSRTFVWKQPAYADPGSWNGNPAANPEGAPRNPDFGEVGQGSDYLGTINGDFIIKYNKEISSGLTLDALGGANYYQTSQRSEATVVTNLVVPGFFNLSNTNKPPTTTDQSFSKLRMGIYGQVTLGYKDQLYLTGNIRNDWSSTLPIGANSIFYPGANLSWLASQLLNSNSTLSFLKFRAAYGKTGSDPDPYLVLPQLGAGTANLPLGNGLTFPFNGVSGFGVNNTIGNPDLKPIFTTELEFGTEARFFRDRFGIDVTLYDKKTDGQIFTVPIAASSGFTGLVENLGKVDNKGIELAVNLKAVESKNFNWNITYVFSKNINKVEQLTGASQDPLLNFIFDAEMRAVVGKSVASIYDVVPQKSPTGQIVVNPATGMPLPNETEDNLGLTKGYMGSGLYDYTMGLTNTFSYKDFSLNFSLDFRYGGVMYSETANILLFVGNSVTTTYNDRHPFIIPNSVIATTDGSGKTVYSPNTVFVGSKNVTPGNTLNESDQNYNYYGEGSSFSGGSDAMRIIDRSFLKLRDINLSYTMPTGLASKIRARSASLGIYGKNFLLWTPKSNVYVDPEATNLGNDLQGQLGEFEGTPLTKSYGIILKLNF